MQNLISQKRKQFLAEISKTSDLSQVESLKIKYLGRKGLINDLLKGLKDTSQNNKKKQGGEINRFKSFVSKALSELSRNIVDDEKIKRVIDETEPGKKRSLGSLHLVSQAIEEIVKIFEKLGFVRMSYPEVEWEYFAFEALNMPANHPARDDFETFFLDVPPHKKYGRMLLTPHTSSGQVREMWRVKTPPIKMINIGKTYRPNWDASHIPMFHQFEGLVVDKSINITHLKGTIEYFVKEFFGAKRLIRLRPFHFQFTEPSFEVDITCDVCSGTGKIETGICKVCKSGWLELGGAGMVHRNVLKAGKIDGDLFTGWAFGFGVERVAMMKDGLKLPDIRILYGGDLRFLEQF